MISGVNRWSRATLQAGLVYDVLCDGPASGKVSGLSSPSVEPMTRTLRSNGSPGILLRGGSFELRIVAVADGRPHALPRLRQRRGVGPVCHCRKWLARVPQATRTRV